MRTTSSLCAYLRAAVQEIFTNLDNRQRRYLLAAKKYVGEHYMDSSLSLDGVAAQLGISPPYLSRIFSEIDGKRFTQYLSDLRIEKQSCCWRMTAGWYATSVRM